MGMVNRGSSRGNGNSISGGCLLQWVLAAVVEMVIISSECGRGGVGWACMTVAMEVSVVVVGEEADGGCW